MTSHDAHGPVFLEVLIFLAAAVIAVPVAKRLGLGSVLGYLIAGIVIGPYALQLLGNPERVMPIAELGVVMLLFLVGLELHPSRLWRMRRDVFGLGSAQILVTGAVVALYPLLVVGRDLSASLVAGLGLALSSTALVMQLLAERNETQSEHGQKAFSILLMQDVAIVPLLAVVAILAPGEIGSAEPFWLSGLKIVGVLGGLVLAGRYLVNPLFRLLARSGAHEVMTAAALLLVIGAATLVSLAGLSMAMGAFLAGVLLAESNFRHELEADIEPFRGVLLGLFFVSVGMTVDVNLILQDWAGLLSALVVLITLKASTLYGVMRLFGNGHATSLRTALLLPQGGEFGFVLFGTAVTAGVMAPDHATLLIALVTLSMAVTPLTVALGNRLLRRRAASIDEDFSGARGSVLVVGFGRFGQIVSQHLLSEGIEVTTIDNDVEMIEAASRFGFRVYYGDGTRLDVLRAAGAGRAELIAVCVDDREAALEIVDLVRSEFRFAKLFVRAYDRTHTLQLLERGVDYQLRETFESAAVFGRATLEALGVPPDRAAEIEEGVRLRDAERLALQLTEGLQAGQDLYHVKPVRPEPFVQPRRPGRAVSAEGADPVGGAAPEKAGV